LDCESVGHNDLGLTQSVMIADIPGCRKFLF
jgi:hypothetical protein